MFKANHIYYQFKKGELTAVHMESGKRQTIKCVGLSHPRTLMGNFFEIESSLKQVTNAILPKSWFQLAPIGIGYLLETSDGGYTNVEIRAFREAILGAGVSRVIISDSAIPLSIDDIKQNNFKELESA